MKHPTAAELHDIVRNPNPPVDAYYEGGLDVGRAHFNIRSERLDTEVDFTVRVGTGSMGSASVYQELSPDVARELAGALERAADAADATRNLELERNR